ncbi:MAG TPA: DUF2336 domain-containing protein [Xanthobacteraceae bacterium]|jgi:hypothetical protein
MSRCHLILDEIETGAGSDSVGRRLELLQNVTDLFVAGSSRFSGAEIALFDDILMRLTAEIESEARERLAQRLAALADAPPKVIRRLAFDDEIAVAAPVLTASPQLSDADLVENAARNSQHLLYAIAQRLKLSEAVTEVLIERGDRRVVRRAARNAGARFSLAGYERTVEHASRDRKLALTLGQRGDVPRQCYLKLLETASAEVRERLEAISPEAAQAIREAVAEVAGAKQAEAGESSPSYTRSARPVSSSAQGPTPVGNQRAWTGARREFRQDRDRAVDARRAAHRYRGTRAARQGHRHDPHAGQGRGLDHHKSDDGDATAGRALSQEDIEKAFKSCELLNQATARRVIRFYALWPSPCRSSPPGAGRGLARGGFGVAGDGGGRLSLAAEGWAKAPARPFRLLQPRWRRAHIRRQHRLER